MLPWYHLCSPKKLGLAGYCHILGAISGAPVIAYWSGFSKPLGKEFVTPANAAFSPLGGSLLKSVSGDY